MSEAVESGARRLRLWPGVAAVTVQWLVWFLAPEVLPGSLAGYAMAAGLLLGALGVVIWWAFFSRAGLGERWGALLLMAAAMSVTPRLLHESVAKGNMGLQFFLYAIPVLCLAFVGWAVATRRLAKRLRRATMIATILLACGVFTLLRSRGVTGDGAAEFTWRWARTPEERLLAQSGEEPPALPSKSSGLVARVEWAGFRGSARDGAAPGVRIETDWSTSPPTEIWRRPVGPGVSAFAVRGELFYTQEQRGEEEIVAAYRLATGEPVWTHREESRFWDPHVGAGPRATPVVRDDRVFALGAAGILSALDAESGAVLWRRDLAAESGGKTPTWGFVSSPLVVADTVIVHAGSLAAYDVASGELRWLGPEGVGSYSSPHLLEIGGDAQVVLVTHGGPIGVAPAHGSLLWEHPWVGIGIVQPALAAEGEILISMVDGGAAPIGTRRIAVTGEARRWRAEELWTSTGLKPSFSSIVVHRGHAFGFDGRILACIDLGDGSREWKGGRYGQGQLLLLPDQDLLLVLSERGELALVSATPDRFTELARIPALEGKTWTPPALVGDLLLVRNGQEMAAFRLALAD